MKKLDDMNEGELREIIRQLKWELRDANRKKEFFKNLNLFDSRPHKLKVTFTNRHSNIEGGYIEFPLLYFVDAELDGTFRAIAVEMNGCYIYKMEI